jgi:Fur family zinc uptake transcriptional regulator
LRPEPAFPKPGHNHARCTADALRKAEAICGQRKTRLTDIRRQVLELVWQSHAPIGAYDILSQINEGGGRPPSKKERALTARGGKTAPMAVYRALDFLMENGLVHRIASRNAFIGCAHMGEDHHAAQFLICHKCGTTAELENPTLTRALKQAVAERGFSIDSQIVEISGTCPHCRAA